MTTSLRIVFGVDRNGCFDGDQILDRRLVEGVLEALAVGALLAVGHPHIRNTLTGRRNDILGLAGLAGFAASLRRYRWTPRPWHPAACSP